MNWAKSEFILTQRFVFFGEAYDLVAGLVRPSEEAVAKVLALCRELRRQSLQTARFLLRLLGVFNSVADINPYWRLHMIPLPHRSVVHGVTTIVLPSETQRSVLSPPQSDMRGSPHFPQNVFNIVYGQLNHRVGSSARRRRLCFRDMESSGGQGKHKLSREPLLISPLRSDHPDSNRQLDLHIVPKTPGRHQGDRNRLVCHHTEQAAAHLLQPLPGTSGIRHRRQSMDWYILPFPYLFPPSPILPVVLQKVKQSINTFLVIAPLWPHQSWYPNLISLSLDHPLCLPQREDLLVQDLPRKYWVHPNPGLFQYHAWLLSRSTADQIALPQRDSTGHLYNAKWEEFCHWCHRRKGRSCLSRCALSGDVPLVLGAFVPENSPVGY